MMIRQKTVLSLSLFLSFLFSGCLVKNPDIKEIKIAFISDVHLQDIVDHPMLIRTMQSQVTSTRLFNENYFALLAALEDVVSKDIKLVVFPGDLTDDGQVVNQLAVRRILDEYSIRHGLRFFTIPGNHDPSRPYDRENTNRNFLMETGATRAISSSPALLSGTESIHLEELQGAGYEKMVACYADFGYYPREEDRYWETPFTDYTYENYSPEKALQAANIHARSYLLADTIPPLFDVSYLVEPVEGLWLLAIDANVYFPQPSSGHQEEMQFSGTESRYNRIFENKTHLQPWITHVREEAHKHNKTLITFSHYPLTDFNKNTSAEIKELFRETAFDSHRLPAEKITRTFAEIGIRIHFAGHMHVNDTDIYLNEDGTGLVNIQVPSLATYIPGYKILTLKNPELAEVETVTLEEVPGFNSLFPLYEKEYQYRLQTDPSHIWDKEILQTSNYKDFCTLHFKELVRLRFIPQDLPSIAKDSLLEVSGKDLYTKIAKTSPEDSFSAWTGFDLIHDLYRLKYGDQQAIQQIGEKRLNEYQVLFEVSGKNSQSSEVASFLSDLAVIFHKLMHGVTPEPVQIDLKNGRIRTE